MQVKQWQRSVNRKFDPPGKGTFSVAVAINRDGLSLNLFTGLAGVNFRYGYGGRVRRSSRRLAKEFFPPMPEQYKACGDRVEPAALGNEHRLCNAFPSNGFFRD